MAENDVLKFAAQIVSAHISRNAVSSTELSKLIVEVHRALTTAGEPIETLRAEPAVAIRQSVKPDRSGLPRVRQTLLNVEAASGHRPQTHDRPIPSEMGLAA